MAARFMKKVALLLLTLAREARPDYVDGLAECRAKLPPQCPLVVQKYVCPAPLAWSSAMHYEVSVPSSKAAGCNATYNMNNIQMNQGELGTARKVARLYGERNMAFAIRRLKGFTISFLGDSSVRQVFIGFACLNPAELNLSDVKWIDDAGGDAGQTFNEAEVVAGGVTLRYKYHTSAGLCDGGLAAEAARLGSKGIAVWSAGFEQSSMGELKEHLTCISKQSAAQMSQPNGPSMVYLHPLGEHFGKNGSDGMELNHRTSGESSCAHWTYEPPRKTVENQFFAGSERGGHSVVDLRMLYDDRWLGGHKVGQIGSFGALDCRDYCMPGPPNVLADMLLFELAGRVAKRVEMGGVRGEKAVGGMAFAGMNADAMAHPMAHPRPPVSPAAGGRHAHHGHQQLARMQTEGATAPAAAADGAKPRRSYFGYLLVGAAVAAVVHYRRSSR